MKVIVGTRGSKLALTQTNWIVDILKKNHPNVCFEIKTITTKGDIVLDKSIEKIGGKAVFIKEIEKALSEKEIDLAVHSMKDMPVDIVSGLKISYTPEREDPRDCLVLRQGYNSISELPKGAKIATGSKRRKYQLLKLRPDLDIVPIRGNIETRINKIETENLDGIVLATAGINRNSLEQKITQILDIDEMIPSPTQGILCLQVREQDTEIEDVLKCIYHEKTQTQADVEREFLKVMGGNCNVPLGCYCQVEQDSILIKGFYGDDLGEVLVFEDIKGYKKDYKNSVLKLCLNLKQKFIKMGGVLVE